jgi:hypothetical protein
LNSARKGVERLRAAGCKVLFVFGPMAFSK